MRGGRLLVVARARCTRSTRHDKVAEGMKTTRQRGVNEARRGIGVAGGREQMNNQQFGDPSTC